MSSALAHSSLPAETKWTVVSGPMKGTVRLMKQTQFSMGRSTECEFVIINDPKCSRKHATVLITAHGVEIISESDKNIISVNGHQIERARLRDGDIVTLGDTEIQFNSTGHSLDPAKMAIVRPQGGGYQAPARAQSGPARSGPSKSNPLRLAIYAIIGVVVILILLPSKQKGKKIDLRTEQQIQADIEAATKLKQLGEAQAMKRGDDSLTSRQAQENYVRGFRDYKKGQYERSLVSFQACLALNPEHTLCNRYIRLAERRFNELIQYEMVLGRKYRDQNQFKACRAAFKNVMVMVKDANSAAYQEAKANYEACNSFLEGRY